MNDYEWWLAESPEQATESFKSHYGVKDDSELADYGCYETPILLGDSVLDTLFYVDEEYKKGPEYMEQWLCECGAKADGNCRWNGRAYEHHHPYPVGHVRMRNIYRRSFREELKKRTDAGVTSPEMFASSEF